MIFKWQTFFFIGYVFFALLSSGCGSREEEEIDPETIAFFLRNETGLQGACERFLQTENLCVINRDNTPTICNGTFQSDIRNGIQPENLRTDDLVEKYIRCFDECNVQFNLITQCTDAKYSTNRAYRAEQRKLDGSGSSQVAQAQWNACYNNCRSVNGGEPPESSGLRGSGTQFPVDWFEGE